MCSHMVSDEYQNYNFTHMEGLANNNFVRIKITSVFGVETE